MKKLLLYTRSLWSSTGYNGSKGKEVNMPQVALSRVAIVLVGGSHVAVVLEGNCPWWHLS